MLFFFLFFLCLCCMWIWPALLLFYFSYCSSSSSWCWALLLLAKRPWWLLCRSATVVATAAALTVIHSCVCSCNYLWLLIYISTFSIFFPSPFGAGRPHGYVRHFGCKINAVAFVALWYLFEFDIFTPNQFALTQVNCSMRCSLVFDKIL